MLDGLGDNCSEFCNFSSYQARTDNWFALPLTHIRAEAADTSMLYFKLAVLSSFLLYVKNMFSTIVLASWSLALIQEFVNSAKQMISSIFLVRLINSDLCYFCSKFLSVLFHTFLSNYAPTLPCLNVTLVVEDANTAFDVLVVIDANKSFQQDVKAVNSW